MTTTNRNEDANADLPVIETDTRGMDMTKFAVHIWQNGTDKGRVSCLLSSKEDADKWVSDWKSVAPRFERDDLRVTPSQA